MNKLQIAITFLMSFTMSPVFAFDFQDHYEYLTPITKLSIIHNDTCPSCRELEKSFKKNQMYDGFALIDDDGKHRRVEIDIINITNLDYSEIQKVVGFDVSVTPSFLYYDNNEEVVYFLGGDNINEVTIGILERLFYAEMLKHYTVEELSNTESELYKEEIVPKGEEILSELSSQFDWATKIVNSAYAVSSHPKQRLLESLPPRVR